MALIRCPECSKEISDKAASCPSCGCPISEFHEPLGSVQCPKCSSTQTVAKKRGVDAQLASDVCCMSVILGPFALLCAAPQANQLMVQCLKCGHEWNAEPAKKP